MVRPHWEIWKGSQQIRGGNWRSSQTLLDKGGGGGGQSSCNVQLNFAGRKSKGGNGNYLVRGCAAVLVSCWEGGKREGDCLDAKGGPGGNSQCERGRNGESGVSKMLGRVVTRVFF